MKPIRSATVVGSGIMGSQIAGHLASCGIPVLLLDMPAKEGKRNAKSESGKEGLRKVKPSPLYLPGALDLIEVGNTEDDLAKAGKTDLIIEAIVELPEPKKDLFAKLQPFLGPDTILATNTSGIPLKVLCEHLSEDLQTRFVGAHFFNPPRYLRLVELIAGPKTSGETLARMDQVLTKVLNKVPVMALDSPAFIANRIGVHAMVRSLAICRDLGLNLEEVDSLTGSLLGRPKTATFPLADLVGLDTLAHIIQNLGVAFPKEGFVVDASLQKLLEGKQFGRKTGAGFYKKTEQGVLALDLETGEYREEKKARFDELKEASKEETLEGKIKKIFAAEGRGADAARRILTASMHYAVTVASQVAQRIDHVDEAMEFGFGWEAGPFKLLDMVGPVAFAQSCQLMGLNVPDFASKSVEGESAFYRFSEGKLALKPMPGAADGAKRLRVSPRGFSLALYRQAHTPVIQTSDASLWDIGEGVLLLEFHSKMNSMGPISLDMIKRSVDKASSGPYAGLVIGNQGKNFCAGANIALVLLDAANGEFDNIDAAVKAFQTASMAIKYAPVPVVVSPHNMALGGGCEFVIHSNRSVLSAETYTGLVEVGVGLLPAGGGTKELTIRAMDPNREGIPLLHLRQAFELIAMGKVSTSGQEAIAMGLLDGKAIIANNESTRLDQAKAEVLALSRAGYRAPAPANHVEVLGKEALGVFETGIYLLREAGFASEHDAIQGMAIARIMSGGNLTPGTVVDENYLLDLEREEFLKLTGMKKTQERIEYMLKKGKPLRN